MRETLATPSRESLRGLDWFIFFLADVQTGFGPFIAVYLTTQKWTQGEIGLVLSIGGVVALIGQMPGGAIVDVIVDRAGVVRAAVIDFGGFLGVGSRKIVVDWNALHFGHVANKGDSITLELTKEQVTAAPEYKEDQPIVVLGAAGSLKPLQFDP